MSFGAEELRKYIATELNSSVVPAGHKGALVAYVDDSGVRIAVAWKSHNGWELSSQTSYHPHDEGLAVGFNVLKTW